MNQIIINDNQKFIIHIILTLVLIGLLSSIVERLGQIKYNTSHK